MDGIGINLIGMGYRVVAQNCEGIGVFSAVYIETPAVEEVKIKAMVIGSSTTFTVARYRSYGDAAFVMRRLCEWDSISPYVLPSADEAEEMRRTQ